MELKKPLTLFCYICGREFGSSSLQIHLKSCEKKFNIEQNKKEEGIRIQMPQAPQLLSEILGGNYQQDMIDQYNSQAIAIHKYQVLPACKYCGRTFNAESLSTHEKGCNSKKDKNVEKVQYKIIDEWKKPRTLTCCVCGRDFGLTSLKIHYGQCVEKFKNQEIKKNKIDRRQIPQFSQQEINLINNKNNWSLQQIEQFNKGANELYRNKGLMQCQNCGRKFLPESLIKHKKNCTLIHGELNKGSQKKIQINQELNNFRKPKVLMCYICGRQFGLTSLTIHQKQCKEKFQIQEDKKVLADRKPLPQFNFDQFNMNQTQTWSIDIIQQYNKRANLVYRNQAMAECPICSRKFIQQSLPKHLKYCQVYNKAKYPQKAQLKRPKSSNSLSSEIIKKPKVLVCYICGRQFGLTSLLIHQKQCIEKFINEQNKKNLQNRKSIPQFTDNQNFDLKSVQGWSRAKIDQYNQLAINIYRNQVLEKCPNCGRKFFKQSLIKHIKNCGNNKSSKSIQLDQSQKRIGKPKVLMCHICGRQFGVNSLHIHLQSCPKKFINQQKKKPKIQRKLLPQFPEQAKLQYDITKADIWDLKTINRYNQIANQVYRAESLSECPICHRKFFEESLPKHLKHCQKQKEKRQTKQQIMQAKSRKTFTNSLSKNKEKQKFLLRRPMSSKQFQQINQEKLQHQSQNQLDQQLFNNHIQNKIKNYQCEDIVSEKDQCLEETNKDREFIQQKQQIQQKQSTNKLKSSCNIIEKSLDNYNQPQNNQESIKKQPSIKDIIDDVQPQQSIEKALKLQKQTKQGQQSTQVMNPKIIQQYKQEKAQLKKCKGCFRQFTQDRIQKHQAVCKEANKYQDTKTFKKETKKQQNIQKQQIQQIQRINCQKCNRGFAKERLIKHMEICKGTGDKNKQNISQKQHPQKKQFQNQSLLAKINKQQPNSIKEDKIDTIACIGCNRKFTNDRIQKHQQICKKAQQKNKQITMEPKNKQKKIQEVQKDSQIEIQDVQRVQCSKCIRKFTKDRLEKHFDICKGTLNKKQLPRKQINPIKNLDKKVQIFNKIYSHEPQEQEFKPIQTKKCSKCQRNFQESRYEKHISICQAQNLKIKEQKSNQNQNSILNKKFPIQGQDQYKEEKLTQCEKCLRNFNPERIGKHKQICKGLKVKPQIAKAKKQVQEESLRETKHKFLNMVKDLKQKKIPQTEIDKQLDLALISIQKTSPLKKKCPQDPNSYFLPPI